jgi:pyridoxamine 5'-phosphate oxidase
MSDLTATSDPIVLFGAWLQEAEQSEPNDPNAMALATVDAAGVPNVRMVLLKAFGEAGFAFYTNLESAKGRELAANPHAALCFHWKSLNRQVRLRGAVERVTDAEAETYFASRARQSQLGAIASRQSQPLVSRAALEEEVAALAAKYGDDDIPRPQHWSGFRLKPVEIEFWQAGAFRLHDRLRFTRARADQSWTKVRLYP